MNKPPRAEAIGHYDYMEKPYASDPCVVVYLGIMRDRAGRKWEPNRILAVDVLPDGIESLNDAIMRREFGKWGRRISETLIFHCASEVAAFNLSADWLYFFNVSYTRIKQKHIDSVNERWTVIGEDIQ